MDTQLANLDPATPFDPMSEGGPATTVADGLALLRIGFVNVFLVGEEDCADREWVLVDAGLPGSARRIRHAAEARFGPGVRPRCIVLTHAHFDHVGALETLASEWDCEIWAHQLELPFLTGRSSYPPFDPTVGGGAMARMSPLFPRGPLHLSGRVRALSADGSIPGMPGWRWIHTPGHTPGHVSLFRDDDRVLVAGDAVVTTKQESMLAAFTQRAEMHGPPAYATPDWPAAHHSVQAIAELAPRVLATGHGRALEGDAVQQGLELLARDFWAIAVPDEGRYVAEPALFDADGVVHVPPPVRDDALIAAGVIGLAALAGFVAWRVLRRRDEDAAFEGEEFDAGVELEAALLAGDERHPVGSAFEAEQHVPVADDGAAEVRPDYGTQWGDRYRIRPESGEPWSAEL